ncbi:Lrp/AsnC family transcriptional regulator [Limnohabitans planktonicus]|jgi:DNA-binding Lrp family transcriptional regulator|uniref:AsnC family transcriptional regulator n=1 Tax=Limnohabitans planktonicus II-D5 TaxID=1293045 RepID=A0A2T7UC42_9BURK|nr:Lrp/AsnC family transcriptional regulator [Limnohabitans planktonicus]PVE42280.1 AsnC family transcriptional regulator [Limnohabitans planktonicus II-D5]|eukprot:gene1148-1125_t
MKDIYSQKILEALQEDARMTVQQISERVGLSTTPCWKRIKEMEAQGIITGYTVRVDRKKVGLGLMVLAEINVTQHTEKAVAEFIAAVQATPQIVNCYSTTGTADYVLTVMVQDIDVYEHFLMQTLFKLPAVSHVRSSIVLRDIKQEAGLPL